MAKKKRRARTARRAAARSTKKLQDAREKLALLSDGGAPERPIRVESASVVESVAERLGCARCEGPTRVDAHEAVSALRRVRTECKRCGHPRTVWLQIASRQLS